MSFNRRGFLVVLTVVSLIIAMLAPAMLGCVKTVFAQSGTYVSIDPPSQTVGNIGDSFTVNVTVTNVTNLFGFEFKLYYDPTVMNGTQATQGSFLKSGGGQVLFSVVNFNDIYNSTYGLCFISALIILPANAPGVNGSGVLATIQFKALAPADSVPLNLADVKLSDPNSHSINTDVRDGTVTIAAVDSWPMFHRELVHTGYSPSPAPTTNQILWSSTTGASVFSSPAVSDGVVFVGSYDKSVYAINETTGAKKWIHPTGGLVYSSPAVVDGMVFVGSYDGYVYALNASTGDQKWRYQTGASVVSSPAVSGGLVFVGSDDKSVYAINETTGTQVWSYTTNLWVESSPAVSGGVVFVGSGDGYVYALNASSSPMSASVRMLWRFQTNAPVFSSPAVSGGIVFVGSDKVYALNASTGSDQQSTGNPIWTYTTPTGSAVDSSPAVSGGVVFVGSGDGYVYALNASSSASVRMLWRFQTNARVVSSPAVSGGIVFVGSEDHKVYALNASDHTLVWSYTTDSAVDSSPAVASGRVFVGSGDSKVYAFGLSVSISSSSAMIDMGQSVTFTSAVYGGSPPYKLQWWYNSTAGLLNTTAAATSSWTFTPPVSGFYTVYVTVTDNAGASAKSNIVTFTVNPALSVSISPTTITMDVGHPQPFTSSVSGGSSPYNYNYQWYLNGVPFTGATSATWSFSPSFSGSYSIYLNVTDTGTNPRSWAESNIASVTVNPVLSARVFPTTVTMFVGESQLFASSVSGGTFPYFYRWYLDGQAVPGATSGKWTFTPLAAGTYTIYVKVNDAVGEQVQSDTSVVTVAVVDSWPMFHHDLTHTGYSTSTAPRTNQILWTYPTGSAVYSSPIVSGDIVYVGSDKVYALNASTGALIWSYATGSNVRSSLAVSEGVVYVGSDKVYALNASTGALIWSYTTGGQVYSSPALADNRVYAGSADGKVYALDASTGALLWNYTTGASVVSSPAVSGGVVFVGSEDHRVYALNEMTGAYIWSYTTGNLVDSSPAVSGGVVYVGSYDGNVYALDAFTGLLKWSHATGGPVYSSPAVAGGVVYVGSFDDKIYAWRADSTGAPISGFPVQTGGQVYSSPAVAGGVVFVGSYDDSVYALDASNGAPIWSYKTGFYVISSPAVYDGFVFVGSCDGNVYAFGVIPLSASISPSSVNMDFGQSQPFNSSVTGGISPYTYQWFNAGPVETYNISAAVPGHAAGVNSYAPTAMVSNDGTNLYITIADPASPTQFEGAVAYISVAGYVTGYAYESATRYYLPFIGQGYWNGGWVHPPPGSGAGSFSTVLVPGGVTFTIPLANIAGFNTALYGPVNVAFQWWDISSPGNMANNFILEDPTGFTAGFPTGPYDIYLSRSPAVSGATGATWTFAPSSPGVYNVYLIVTDNIPLSTESNIVSITVSSAPSVRVSPTSITVDAGQSQNFVSTISGGASPYAYQWYRNGAPVSGANSSTWTFTTSSSGNYTVYVNVTDSFGFSAKSNVVSVIVNPALSVVVSPTIVTIAAVVEFQVFTSNVAGGTSPVVNYQWYLNGIPVSGGSYVPTYNFTPPSAGVYTVYLNVTDSAPATVKSNTAIVNVTAVAFDWWPMFHHDSAHTGNSTSTPPTTNQTLWTYTTSGLVYSSPAVYHSIVYVGSYDGNVYALDASTGKPISGFPYKTGGEVHSSPAVSGGMVYVGSDKVYALDANSGALIWNYTTSSAVYSSPAVANGIVYVGSLDGNVYALNASTGKPISGFPVRTSGQVWSSPAVANGIVYVGSLDGKVYALDASTGNPIWTYTLNPSNPTGSAVYSSPAVYGGIVYVGSYDGNVYALGALDGHFVWKHQTGGKVYYSSPAVSGSTVYVGSYDGNVSAFYAINGTSMWNYTTGSTVDSSPAVAGSIVYVGSDKVYALDNSTGALVWSYATGADVASSPAVAGGIVYVGSNNDKVYAFTQTPLSASISSSTGVMDVGQSQLFTSNVTGGTTLYTYQWYLNGALVSGATNPTYTLTPTSAGSYTVYLKANDSASAATTSNTVSVTVYGLLSIRVTPSSVTMDMGLSQSFISTVSGGASPFNFQWCLDGAAVPGATNSTWTYTPSSSGAHNVYVNVTDNARFTAKSNITTVTVKPAISASISPPSVTLNVGQSQPFNSNVSGGASPYSYQWYLNNASVSNATSSWTFTPPSAGSYTVYLKVSDSVGGQATSNTANVTVNGNQTSYALTMYTVGQGKVYPGNGTSYAAGKSVGIQEVPDAGWLFAGWTGSVTGQGNMTITMNGNMFVTATFTQGTFSLTMYTVGQGKVYPGNGTSYAAGTSVNITAITVAGWAFQGWSGNAIGLSNTTIVMNGNMFVTATFSQVVAGHDVAVTKIASDKTSIGQGTFSNVTVTIGNLGNFTETFNVTVYANQTATNQTVIATFVNITLASGSFTQLWFMWNTTAFAKGNYTIIAYAGPVPGDMNTANNYLSTGPVAVTILGDLNGDFKVSLADLTLLASAYGSTPSSANWNPNADINGSGKVDLSDLVTMATHYGQHFP